MIDQTQDYRTRDEKLDDFQTAVTNFQEAVHQTTLQLSEAIIRLQNRVTLLEARLDQKDDYEQEQRDQRG